jgi:hypothetical protein
MLSYENINTASIYAQNFKECEIKKLKNLDNIYIVFCLHIKPDWNSSVFWLITCRKVSQNVNFKLPTPRNNPEDGRIHFNRDRSLRFHNLTFITSE